MHDEKSFKINKIIFVGSNKLFYLCSTKKYYMEYKIFSSSSPQGLSNTINLLIGEGWEPIGSHQVVIVRDQNRYRGTQHIDTTHETEYSQTMNKK